MKNRHLSLRAKKGVRCDEREEFISWRDCVHDLNSKYLQLGIRLQEACLGKAQSRDLRHGHS